MEEVKEKNNKIFLIVGLVVGVLLLGLLFFFLVKNLLKEKAKVSILVAPETAEILINGELYKNGVYTLPTGKYSVSISAEGFSYSEFDFEVEKDTPNELFEYLVEEGKTYSENDYEILSLIADDEYTIKKINSRARAKTIEALLPLRFPEYSVYFSNQSGNKACDGNSLCLSVTNLGDLTEDSALSLLREKGYDPNDYKILYEEGTTNYYTEAEYENL